MIVALAPDLTWLDLLWFAWHCDGRDEQRGCWKESNWQRRGQAVFSDTLCAPVRPLLLQRALIDANSKTTRKTSAKTAKQRTPQFYFILFLLRSPNWAHKPLVNAPSNGRKRMGISFKFFKVKPFLVGIIGISLFLLMKLGTNLSIN